ncbi:MFS general substrate transporter [Lepidopterella palustris CBS 459.81]|uniref:MFS general substrate transporter n=1 Tax=Lepidopterella palustris CBS 459.81 TaxID=1314670 RepID=A0A8E2EFX6_9PEZI|nr:MFS general substrate transporter [Lepidopterella palustris CBS 459.81]
MDHRYHGSGTESDPFIVEWINNDPENPKEYPGYQRHSFTTIVAIMCLCVSLSSSAFTGAIRPMIEEFHCSNEVAILGLSLMLIGYVIGPLLWAPMSEAFGRRDTLIGTFALFVLWSGVCAAAQNIASLLIFRFFAGLFGSSALVIPGGIVADMYPVETRGIAMAIFTTAPFLGPSLGPMIGGFLSDAAGWRWVMGFLALLAGVLTTLGFLFLPETYGPTILRSRAKRMSRITGRVFLTAMDAEHPVVFREIVKHALIRPWILLFREPIVLSLTIYMSVVYGTLYLCFAAFPIVFQEGRGWSAGVGGLAFMGVLGGMMSGCAVSAYDNVRYMKIHRASGGFAPPESRLPPVIFGGAFIIVGLAWFAATNSPSIPWASPVLAGVPFAFGFVLVIICCSNYLIDAYVIYAASLMAANSLLRSLFGAVFPLFGDVMYKNLGIHWASAVPGFMALACFPFPIIFYIYGPRIRKRCKYAAEAARHLELMKSGLERQPTRESAMSTGFTFSEEPDNMQTA